jgi:GNAT superfamily N-acetyltransferase
LFILELVPSKNSPIGATTRIIANDILFGETLELEVLMIRKCKKEEVEAVREVINEATQVYKEIIPVQRWHEPYMLEDQLRHEISSGITFWGYAEGNQLLGVMGIQPIEDVTLIRHAYVRTEKQGQGIGGRLLTHLYNMTTTPVLIGTWADAFWAIGFYRKHGFCLVPEAEKEHLLYKYWTAPKWHLDMSVVLADRRWVNLNLSKVK